MPEKKQVRPTNGELEILRKLWERGPSTVREVHRALAVEKDTSCNTTLKLMQIMNEKGLVYRDKTLRPQVYHAALPEKQMHQRLVTDFLDRVFGGSAKKLVSALTATDISQDELAQIRRLLDELEEGRK